MDEHLQDEHDREDAEQRAAIYGNVEARRIVDAVFAEASMPVEAYGDLHFSILELVDARLDDGTPRAEISALAAKWLREQIARRK